ncbi:hypothetical protein ZWY2020_007645 [Hordeum vulgare]|nr:hypothetical protein ZWY2020_007645 [Hordeum vulgare]
MEKPGGEGTSKHQMIDCYIQTLAKVLGSEEEAKKKIYNVSCERYFGFGCEIDEETSNKLEGIPGVLFVLPDSYVDPEHKDYGGSQVDEINWESLTNQELHDKFQQMMAHQVQDFVTSLEEAMEKLDGLEKTFDRRWTPSSMRCLPVYHHQLQLLSLLNNNDDDINKAQILWDERDVCLPAKARILVFLLLLLLLWFLWLSKMRIMVVITMTSERLLQIKTRDNNRHHKHRIIHMDTISMVGLHHPLS